MGKTTNSVMGHPISYKIPATVRAFVCVLENSSSVVPTYFFVEIRGDYSMLEKSQKTVSFQVHER